MGSQLSVYQVTKNPSQFQLSSSFTSIPAGSSSLMAISAAAENLRQPSRHAGRDGLAGDVEFSNDTRSLLGFGKKSLGFQDIKVDIEWNVVGNACAS